MADVAYIPDGNNQANNFLPWYLAGQNNYGGNGGFFGGAGGSAFWGGLIGSVIPGIFGAWNGGRFGGNGGGSAEGAAAASLGAQATANANAALLQNAITGTDADIRLLATTLNTDVDSLKLGINTIQGAIAQVGSQVGMSGLQVINAINAGDAALQAKLCECCCENRLAISQQTNALQGAIAGVNENIAANRAAQQLSDCQQTYALTDTMNRNYLALDNKIDALESSRKDREITALTAKVAQLESQNFTTGVVGSAIAPVNAALNAIAKEVDDIKCKQPSTVSVQYPNLVVANATPFVGGFGGYGAGYGYGYGVPGGSYWG